MSARPLRIAFVSDELPFARTAGHQHVNMALLDFLTRKGHILAIALTAARMPGPVSRNILPEATIFGPGLRANKQLIWVTRPGKIAKLFAKQAVETAPLAIQERIQRLRASLFPGAGGILGRFPRESELVAVAGWINAWNADVVLIDTMFRCPIIPHLKDPKPKLVVLTHDVFHQRHAALSARGLSLDPPTLTRAEETALLGKADIIVAINPEEQVTLKDMLPQKVVIEASLPVQVRPRPGHICRDGSRVLFVGTASIHNIDGLRWFLSEVWPLIRQRVPAAHLDVCGLVGRAITSPPPGVSVLGRVPNLSPLYHRAGVALCPLQAGSGLKIKMLEYFAHGLPCVTTSVGASGFAPSTTPPFVTRDDPQAFAEAVIAFMSAPERIASYEQRAYAYCALYGEDRIFGDLLNQLQVL